MKKNMLFSTKLFFILAILSQALSSCASGNEIFFSGYWVSVLTAILLLGTLFYVIRTVFFSGTEHKP